MIRVSNEYKEMMDKPIRERAYISVGIGIVNQRAQDSGSVDGVNAYWSHGNIFNTNQKPVEYATMEENYLKADGSMYFMPENNELMQLKNNGIATEGILGAIRINFPERYDIKGLTIDFGVAYPTNFTVQTETKTLNYENNSEVFQTMDVIGDTNYILITPNAMVGGMQRFRIKNILMGVGLYYTNEQAKSFKLTEFVSPISAELPKENISFSFFDEEDRFNVDDENSFVGYLEMMQKLTVSFGLDLGNGSIEWHKIATAYLNSWNSKKGSVSMVATDRLTHMKNKYVSGNRIYQRTAYQEAENIFLDAGLSPDEYEIDDYLNDVVIINPMPEAPHKECLQILANACRCVLKQDVEGRVIIRANFATVLDPDDFSVQTNGVTDWSKPENIFIGESTVYADVTQRFLKADGNMYFLPEGGGYLQTSYVSLQISDENGLFEENPYISITLPASYTYYGVNIHFNGNPPQEMVIHIYNNETLIESTEFHGLVEKNYLVHDFLNFNKIVFEFSKAHPYNRILVDKISFGNLSDYVLRKNDLMSSPVGYKEERVKLAKAKIFTYENNEDGEPEEIKDDVYAEVVIGNVGAVRTIENPLVSTEEHARLLAEWIGNYYANNISYDVDYRGEPRISAADIIRMESDKLNNLQIEVESLTLNFNKKFSGTLEVHRALSKMAGG